MSSNGVKISNKKPSNETAQLELIALSATEYNPRDTYQGITNNIKLKWSGFTDDIGVDTYMVVSDLRQVGGFLQVLWFPPPIKLTATI
jgi:hypothetical protein